MILNNCYPYSGLEIKIALFFPSKTVNFLLPKIKEETDNIIFRKEWMKKH